MANNAIEVSGVTQRFGEVRALDDLSLTVAQGEMFGLIGHNGAGKSTLFKLMLGLITSSGGQIRVQGSTVGSADFRRVRRRIGYLPENFVTYDNLSGLEVLRLFADLKRVPHSTCTPLLERVGLAHAAQRRVRGYSKGMRQRLGFAQALLGEPNLVFLDEPTNGLDPEGIHEFYRILRDVQAGGATIVITSHILAEIQERVDSLAILVSGRVAAQGSLAELRRKTVLPSVIRVKPKPGCALPAREVFASLPGLSLKEAADGLLIGCAVEQKIPVLGILAGFSDAIADIAIREPSLEDLFLGYGGAHVRSH
ncbi:MAG TPA: ABC transporter ATP-binding protein [Burkholderiaceae bacterium]|nr:ABC transporter ATP-binding protein [Burkholderiaceae bacterium]